MLSIHNIEKLKMNGLYTCKTNTKYRGKLFENNLYHCCNWTFNVLMNHEDKYFMRDTYWSSGDSVCIPLTDENIGEFELIFECDKVIKIRSDETDHYENHYRVAIDSGGWSYPKYFVDINATKSKKLIIEEIDNKIKSLESEIKYLQERKENIDNGTYKLDWV